MSNYSVVDEPEIEGDQVVVRVAAEADSDNSGPIFVCRMTSFDSMTLDAFPEGQAPSIDGEYRAEATRAVKEYAAENAALFEELFEEIARRSKG